MDLNYDNITCFLPFNKDFNDITNTTNIEYINPNNNISLLAIKNFSPHYKYSRTNVLYCQNWDNWSNANMRCLKLIDSDNWDFTKDFTIQFWFYCPHDKNNYATSGELPNGGYSNSLFSLEPNYYFGIIARDDYFIIHIGNGSNWSYSLIPSVHDIYNKQWYHLACVKRNNVVSCYINGIKRVEQTITGINFNFGKTAYIGKWGSYTYNGIQSSSFGGEFYMAEFIVDIGHAWYENNFIPESFLVDKKLLTNLKIFDDI